MAFNHLAEALESKTRDGLYRQRQCVEYEQDGVVCIDGQHYLNFASNDYLGMRHHPGVLQAWVEGLAQYGAGSGASPLVTGYTRAHEALEAYLAESLNRDAALLFNSGFAANQALCQALFSSPGLIVADKFMHASFLDGAMSSEGTLRRFRHNDMAHLQQLLQGLGTGKGDDYLVASEGIFSMDGDAAPVRQLVELCQSSRAWLMLDDAHGMGVLGERGLGSAEHFQLTQQQLPVLMGTFGKAVGTAGAFIAGSATLINYLVNHARHYIYSTAMPAAQAVATLYSLQALINGERRQRLQRNIVQFRQQATHAGLELTSSVSAIQPVILHDTQIALAVSQALKTRGIWVPAIRYPTVPKNTDRLRITLTSEHSEKDIAALTDALALAIKEVRG